MLRGWFFDNTSIKRQGREEAPKFTFNREREKSELEIKVTP